MENDLFDVSPTLYVVILMMQILGVWPIRTKIWLLNYMQVVWGYIVYVFYTCTVVTAYMELVRLWPDFSNLLVNAMVSATLLVILTKIYIMLFEKTRLHFILNKIYTIEKGLIVKGDQEEREITRRQRARAWTLSKFFCSFTGIVSLSFLARPLFENYVLPTKYVPFPNGTDSDEIIRPFVLSTWFPSNKNHYPYYPIYFSLQFVGCLLAIFYYILTHVCALVIMIFLYKQLKIVQYKFASFTWNTNNDSWKLKNNLIKAIELHQNTVAYFQEVSFWLSPVFFLETAMFSATFCAGGFQLATQGFLSTQSVISAQYMALQLVELAITYWFANEVTEESKQIPIAVWNSEWYSCNSEIRKLLIFVIKYTQRPIVFRAGAFFRMTLTTFLSILKASYSYLTLLLNINHIENSN